ncbi:hypothetical protein [Microbacterium sp. NPDC080220]
MPAADTHGASEIAGRAYCGRKAKTTEKSWTTVTCADCQAARRADEESR